MLTINTIRSFILTFTNHHWHKRDIYPYNFNSISASSATTLTSWHLLVTFCSLHVALRLKFFEHKPFDSRAVMGFGILNGISIGLLNLSLGFNSVGFYQVNSFLFNNTAISVYMTIFYLCNFITDDKISNYSLHCTFGNPILQQAIQVFTC